MIIFCRESGEKVWELLEQGAHLYVCGDAKMMAKVGYIVESLNLVTIVTCFHHCRTSGTSSWRFV